MARAPSPQLYAEIAEVISTPKLWVASPENLWVSNGSVAPGFKQRSPLAHASAPATQVEGLFVDSFYKDSTVQGVPAKLSICLVYQGMRVLALDDNGPSRHFNKVGVGRPHFEQVIDHPHLHLVVADALQGYAEPVPIDDANGYWTQFMAAANVTGYPPFKAPEGQLRLQL